MPDEVSRGLGMEGGGFHVRIKSHPDRKEWILSDCCLQIQARHVAWIKGKRRQEKIDQRDDGVITGEQCREDLAYLDDLFAMGEYSFGKPHWNTCASTDEGAAKLFQLLLEKEQPFVKDWSIEEVQELVAMNPEGFSAAIKDILPKAMGKKTKATAANTPSSKSPPSSRSSRTTSRSRK